MNTKSIAAATVVVAVAVVAGRKINQIRNRNRQLTALDHLIAAERNDSEFFTSGKAYN